MKIFNPEKQYIGGFTQNDGTIDFYLRVGSLLKEDSIVLDMGAGRGAWFEDDECEVRRNIRLIKGRVKQIIAADVDDAVLQNKSSDKQMLIKNSELDLHKESIDLIIADYVLEHIANPSQFYDQINSCLKSGGWFCARTPHKYSYIALISSLIKNKFHAKVLSKVQPNRKEVDVFPTEYKMNDLKEIRLIFKDWPNSTFIYRSEPSYFFGNRFVYVFLSFIHRLFPLFFLGNIFVFVQKP